MMERAQLGRPCVVVVPRDQPDLLDDLRQDLHADPEIELVSERRQGERRGARAGQVPDDRRHADRRQPLGGGETLRLDSVVVAFRAEAPDVAAPILCTADTGAHPDVPGLNEARTRIAHWVHESQMVLRALPTLTARYRALVKVARTLERRRARLANELRTLYREHQRLRAEPATLGRIVERAIPRDRPNGPAPAAGGAPVSAPAEPPHDPSTDAAWLIAAVRERSARMLGGIREAKRALGVGPPTPPRTVPCPRCGSPGNVLGDDARWACVVCAWVGSAPAESLAPL
jgi:hypothetical protein